MRIRDLLLIGLAIPLSISAIGQTLVAGGQFKDRILPMQGSVVKNAGQTIWGASGVQGRYLDNGVEPSADNGGKAILSYWGGNIVKDATGKYHLFLAAWDATGRAHSYWPNSDVYHVTSDTPHGPYTHVSDYNIGQGHNPTVFQAKDGSYVMYVLIGNSAAYRYKSATLDGPWGAKELMPTNLRNRALSTGSTTSYSNWTFAQRADGSVLAMDRGGAVWVSEDGLSAFEEVYDVSAYPGGYQRYYEDPVIWKDEFQYHMIVNHWNDKIAYYSRSKDGIHWVSEKGTAYDPTVATHVDGTSEEWTKFERPRVFQDEYGRAIYLNMAVIDVEKGSDKAGDNHSSKNIVMPLNPGLRMEVLNEEEIGVSTSEIRLKVYSEEGFDPASDLNIESLRFGSHATVNTGGGAVCTASTTDAEGNLILTFNGASTGLTDDEFAPKLIGTFAENYTPAYPNAKAGSMCYGYARLRYIDYEPSCLSPELPVIGDKSQPVSVRVKNYGLKASTEGVVVKVASSSGQVLATGSVASLAPYAEATVTFEEATSIPSGSQTLKVGIYEDGKVVSIHTLQLAGILNTQNELLAAISEAEALYANTSYRYGKESLLEAIGVAKTYAGSFYEVALDEAMEALKSAINVYKFANATANNPVSITLANADMNSLEGWDILHAGSGADIHLNTSNNHNYNKLGSNPFAEAWSNAGVTKPNRMSQTLKDMPVGRYLFEADVIAQKNTGGCTGVTLFINDRQADCSSKQSNWSESYSVELNLTDVGDITIGLDISAESDATWVGMDNAVLRYYGDGSHDAEELFYKASIENVYIKGNGQTANHYITVEPKFDNYLNRITTPNANSLWAKISDSETGNIWLYNISTQSFIIPDGNYWKTSASIAQKTVALEPSGTGYQIKCMESGSKPYMNAYGGFAVSRTITTGLTGYPVGGYTSGVWDFQSTASQDMPSFVLENITTGREELVTTLTKLPKAAIIELGADQYTTFCAPFNVAIPEGMEVYTATINVENATIELARIENEIPLNTPVVLYAEKDFGPYYVCGDTEALTQTCSDGHLTGVLSAQIETEGFLLQKNASGDVGFSKQTSSATIMKNNCFIPSRQIPSGIDFLKLVIADDNTGISEVIPKVPAHGGQAYNVVGQPVRRDAKGLIITNGKKIWVP